MAWALTLCDLHVTAENINERLDHAGVPPEFDFFSLEVDYNRSHIWRTIEHDCFTLTHTLN